MGGTIIASNVGEDFRKTVSVKLKELRKELQILGKEIEARQNRQAKIARLITHLDGVLELSSNEQKPDTKPALRRADYKEICDLVAQILAEHQKKPVHYQQLADEVQRRGIAIGGANPGRTLVAKISREPRFVRPVSRGFYALRKDYPDSRNVGEHKRRGRKQENGQ